MTQAAVVLQPQPDQEAVKTLIRSFQQEIIDADPHTYMGATTAAYGPDSYVSVRGQGRYLLNAATNRLISQQMAAAMLTQFGAVNPNPPRLTDTPELYSLVRHLVESGVLNSSVQLYLEHFAQELKDAGFKQTVSLPGPIDRYMPSAWLQRDMDGVAGDRISYSNLAARTYSVAVLTQALQYPLTLDELARVELNNDGWQVDADGAPYIYDALAQSGYGSPVPEPKIQDINGVLGSEQTPYLLYLNSTLTDWQDSIGTSILTAHPTVDVGIAVDSVKVLEPASANVLALNQAVTHWASPRYNFIRMEDNSWVASGETSKVPESFNLALVQLGYGIGQIEYTLGPVDTAGNLQRSWRDVDDAWGFALETGVPTVYLWDYSSVVQNNVVLSSPKICGC